MAYSTEQLFCLKDQVVIVTGGSKGIGREIAMALMDVGAIPVIWGSSKASVADAEAAFSQRDGSCIVMQVDVTEEAQVQAATAEIHQRYGRIDGLVNSAGINLLHPMENQDMADFDRVLRVNVIGTMHCCKHAGRIMREKGAGSIVNVGSVRGFQGKERYSAYAASKGAIHNLTHSLGVELAPTGVRVNAIAPCFIRTDFTEDMLSKPEFLDWTLSRLPIGRLGLQSDCVGPVLFFLSPASAFVTGTVLPVDGGWLAG